MHTQSLASCLRRVSENFLQFRLVQVSVLLPQPGPVPVLWNTSLDLGRPALCLLRSKAVLLSVVLQDGCQSLLKRITHTVSEVRLRQLLWGSLGTRGLVEAVGELYMPLWVESSPVTAPGLLRCPPALGIHHHPSTVGAEFVPPHKERSRSC